MLTVSDYLAQPVIYPDKRIPYGDHVWQFGDLYLADTTQPTPVVIMIHGGCWQAAYDLTPLSACCADLRARGYTVWSLEYRRLGNGGGWPYTFLDVAAGVDRLRDLAQPYMLDLNRVIAVGHSAGGQLALWLAARSRLPITSQLYTPNPLPIQGVVALAAVADLVQGVTKTACGSACAELVGNDEVRYQEASPRALLPLGVPHRHLVGHEDLIVPAAYVADFVATACQVGDPAHLTILPACGHFELTTPSSTAWLSVVAAIDEILTQNRS